MITSSPSTKCRGGEIQATQPFMKYAGQSMRLAIYTSMLFGFAASGCAGKQSLPKNNVEVASEPPHEPYIELAGPVCPSAGPSVAVLAARYVPCGKESTCTVLDLRLRNPTDRVLWLAPDPDRRFSRLLDSVSILRPYGAQNMAVWAFAGRSYDVAVRVPAGTDVVVHDFDYPLLLKHFRVVFINRIATASGNDIGDLEPNGLIPSRGEVDLDGFGGFIVRSTTRELFRSETRVRVSIDVRCVLDVAVTESPGDTALPSIREPSGS